MSTSYTFMPLGENDLSTVLSQLRRHAAQVRALLFELDCLTPLCAQPSRAPLFAALSGQLGEEVERLGCLMLECAAALSDPSADPKHSDF